MNESGTRAEDRVELFGVGFDPVTFDEAVVRLIELARQPGPKYAVTANVDHVVRLRRCPELRPIYRDADLVVADGMPIIWASKMCGCPLPERVAGSDLVPALCRRAADYGLSVFLLGGASDTAQRAAALLQSDNTGLRLAGTYCPPVGFERDATESGKVIEAVRAGCPDILFVALGSPKQEQWIERNHTACGAPLSIGVGISFSFLCGDVARAPMWMRRSGLEWLHRLAQEPSRLWRRYLVADLLFVPMVLRQWARRSHCAGREYDTGCRKA